MVVMLPPGLSEAGGGGGRGGGVFKGVMLKIWL